MFGKKCLRCEANLRKRFDFCPTCGLKLKESGKNYGMLGKSDIMEEFPAEELFPGLNSPVLNKMLKGAMKMLEKELGNIAETQDPNNNFNLYINGKKVDGTPSVKENEIELRESAQIQLPEPSENIIQASKKLPREEAKYTLKRLGNKIVYEINLPGVTSLKDVLINKLEDSIEIRAFTKKKVLQANLQINLPLLDYQVQKQKLILEFQGK